MTNGFEGKNKEQLNQQIVHLNNGILNDRDKLAHTRKELGIVRNQQKRLKLVYAEGGIGLTELEQVSQKIIDLERVYKENETSIISKQTNIAAIRNRIVEIDQGYSKSANGNWNKLKESINLLRSKIENWKQKYLLTTPVSGVTSFHFYWNEQQFVQAGVVVMSIIPLGGDSIVGTIFMPVKGSGKVKEGLDVILKMDGYPY